MKLTTNWKEALMIYTLLFEEVILLELLDYLEEPKQKNSPSQLSKSNFFLLAFTCCLMLTQVLKIEKADIVRGT